MDCSLRIKFYPSEFFNEVISVGIVVRVSEYTQRDFEVFEVNYWLGFCRNIPRQSYSNQSEAVLKT